MLIILKTTLLSALILCAFSICADDDVKYRAKIFSGKSLENKKYSAKSYRSDKVSKDKKFKQSSRKSGGFWSFFGRGKKKEYDVLPEQKHQKDNNYKKNEQIALKVEHPEDKALTGEKNLDSTEAKSKDYKPSDIKRGHDPLLAPRQGIKAPVVKIKDD